MKSKSIFTKSIAEIDIQIKQAKNEQLVPNLALVFVSLSVDTEGLFKILNKHKIQYIGVTTSGEIGNKAIQNGGISLLLLEVDKRYFKILQKEADYSSSYTVGTELLKEAETSFNNPAFIMLFSLNISGEALMEGMSTNKEKLPSIFGGMAGDDMQMKHTYTFNNEKMGDNLVTTQVLMKKKLVTLKN